LGNKKKKWGGKRGDQCLTEDSWSLVSALGSEKRRGGQPTHRSLEKGGQAIPTDPGLKEGKKRNFVVGYVGVLSPCIPDTWVGGGKTPKDAQPLSDKKKKGGKK